MAVTSKEEFYRQARLQLDALLENLEDPVAVMATTAAILHQANPLASWTGFYRVVASELLRVGPYQGSVGCLEIPFNNGVCGAAARLRETQVVADVHAFAGHIACDSRARSEIVVPVLDRAGNLVAVLDVDSHEPGAFDSVDREGLESVAALLSRHL